MAGDNESAIEHIHLTTKIQGVVLPTWAAISLAIAAILSTLTLALTILLAAQNLATITREIRVLQLHTQDIESVLERSGLAHRQDFAPWDTDAPSHGLDRADKAKPQPK